MKQNSEYPGYDFNDIEILPSLNLSRREMLKLLGAGITVCFFLGPARAYGDNGGQQDREGQMSFRPQAPADFNAFLRIGEDGGVTCFTGKIEMGQGIITSLAQMLAEELEVKLASVQMVMGDTELCPWDMGTFGSLSTRFFGPTLRAAAAEAKAALMELGAEALQVPLNRMRAKDGSVFDAANSKKKISYGALTRGKRIERQLKKKPALKSTAEFTVIGKPAPRLDGTQKVRGQAQYAGDIRLPGMLYASVLRPPAHGAKLSSVNTSEAQKANGTLIINEGDLIAALHKTPDGAVAALNKIRARFDTPDSNLDDRSIFDHLLKVAHQGQEVASAGDIDRGKALAKEIFNETYLNSYVAHAPIETHAALARVEGDKATVWVSTQIPFMTRDAVARALRFSSENVRVITPFVGGGFGGKSGSRQAVEAARLSKIVGKPVQLAWSREEEFFFDAFRPAAVVKINSGIRDAGLISHWDYSVYFAGDRGASHFYDIPHHRTTSTGLSHQRGWSATPGAHPFNIGPWRAPSANTNTFARESQIDIMAAKAGLDPLEFRLKNLKDRRMTRALKAAADKFGWVQSKSPSGRGCGVACAVDAGSYVVHMARVEVNRQNGRVQVERVVCAQDMGLVINPEGARMQIEGSVTMGLGYALTEEINFKGGKILNLNFDTYDIPRFSWLPKIETVLIDAPDIPPQGCGEPAIVCIGAVVANAIHDAVGARLFQLPMTPERVKKAMSKA